jgi:GT2 family glycosyltransferase
MFVHSSTIGKLKGFDESFKMYMEDVDFCLRAKSEGINSYFLSSPLLYHFISSSVKNKAFKILLSYTKLSIRYTGVFCLFNVPLFILRKILSK